MKQYEAPRVTIVGAVADLTQATGTHNFLDADFPSHTPHQELTFS